MFRLLGVLFATAALLLVPPALAGTLVRGHRMSPDRNIHVAPPLAGAPEGDGSEESPFRDLQKALAMIPPVGDSSETATTSLLLAPGDYLLSPTALVDSTCGNCANPQTQVPATVGLRLSGRRVSLRGAPDHASVIHTGAGYGILVQDCRECSVTGLVVTGGERDTSGEATDAAIVARRSSLTIRDCWIRDNIGDSLAVRKHVVGIIGIAGREGCVLDIEGNRIERNSWDGIALYRDARATIVNNTIDGVDLAVGNRVGGGRGVGIGVTWNAQAEVTGNRVTRYWKGIGFFADARGTVESNVVEQVAAWGLSLWDSGHGHPQADFRLNAVDSTGACGVMIDCQAKNSPPAGSLRENAICRTGQNPKYDSGEPYCFQTAVALHGETAGFPVQGNIFYNNREPGDTPGSGDRNLPAFQDAVRHLCALLARSQATRESAFFRNYGAVVGKTAPGFHPSPVPNSTPKGQHPRPVR